MVYREHDYALQAISLEKNVQTWLKRLPLGVTVVRDSIHTVLEDFTFPELSHTET